MNNSNDKFNKFILAGILICLFFITLNSGQQVVTTSPPQVSVDANDGQRFIQLAPNIIGIIDTGQHTGIKEQLIVFEFDTETKEFQYINTFNTEHVLDHPEEYGIPTRTKNW